MDYSGFENILEEINDQNEQNIETQTIDKNYIDVALLQEQVFKTDNKETNTDTKKEKLQAVHSGHRQRARDRFLLNPEEVSDYDLLELILFLIIPRADTKPIARLLIDKYKTLKKVFNADIESLNALGVNGNALKYILTLTTIFQKRLLIQQNNDDIVSNNSITDIDTLIKYCQISIGKLSIEEFHVLFFDSKLHILADKKFGESLVSGVNVCFRDLIQQCFLIKSDRIVLYHNHPSGDINPSSEDIETTDKIIEMLKNVDIEVLDHIIVGGDNYFSFKQNNII